MQERFIMQIDVDSKTFAGIMALGVLLLVMAMGCIVGLCASC